MQASPLWLKGWWLVSSFVSKDKALTAKHIVSFAPAPKAQD
jgi:hypothetical protein